MENDTSRDFTLPLFGEAEITTTLTDQMTDDSTPQLEVEVVLSNGQIFIQAEGYGDSCSMDGHGHPIAIELAAGKLRVITWSDINEEDPTHIIFMDKAKENLRIEE